MAKEKFFMTAVARSERSLDFKPELLAPAGDIEKLQYAYAYGADAAYIGGTAFGLRAYAGNFGESEMEKAVSLAKQMNRKIYVTVNIFAHEDDFAELPAYLQYLEKLEIDGAIVSDPGIIALAKEVAPNLIIHLSTQANNTNSYTIRFWLNQGVSRVVMARELSLAELQDIRPKVNGELEMFIHGAMCMSYSGRCLISNYLTGRDANRGECTQPCRWGYGLVEQKRPGEVFPIEEDERGTYIFNSHDLCLLQYLPLLKPLNIDSFKIEGRMKSAHYVASTVKVYRDAIDLLWSEREAEFEKMLPKWFEEMDKVSHRDYSAGFLFGKPGPDAHNIFHSNYIREYDFVGRALFPEEVEKLESDQAKYSKGDYDESDAQERVYSLGNHQNLQEGTYWIEQRNHFTEGEEIEVLTPEGDPWTFVVKGMTDKDGEPVSIARHSKQLLKLELTRPLTPYSILRRAKRG